jgi:hypothetical protein
VVVRIDDGLSYAALVEPAGGISWREADIDGLASCMQQPDARQALESGLAFLRERGM